MTKASRLLSLVLIMISSLSGSSTLAQARGKVGFVDAGNGVMLYYRLLGNGSDPVVLIHGGPGLTSDYLAADLTARARNHPLFVYDQRGIGSSTRVTDSTALEKGIGHFPYLRHPTYSLPRSVVF